MSANIRQNSYEPLVPMEASGPRSPGRFEAAPLIAFDDRTDGFEKKASTQEAEKLGER